MKQLKKLKLKDFSEMSDAEMKFVVGGSGGGSGTKDEPYQLPEVVISSCPSGPGSKILDCMGKPRGADCCILYNNKVYTGRCIVDQFNPKGALYCSDAWY